MIKRAALMALAAVIAVLAIVGAFVAYRFLYANADAVLIVLRWLGLVGLIVVIYSYLSSKFMGTDDANETESGPAKRRDSSSARQH